MANPSSVYVAFPVAHLDEETLHQVEAYTGTMWRFHDGYLAGQYAETRGHIWCQWFTQVASSAEAAQVAGWCMQQQTDDLHWLAQAGNDRFPQLNRAES